jgi:hypothetical protein
MSSRNMRLLPRATLHIDSEQWHPKVNVQNVFFVTFSLGNKNFAFSCKKTRSPFNGDQKMDMKKNIFLLKMFFFTIKLFF